MTRLQFSSYDEAYDVLERYCSGFCCSDDDRIEYSIEPVDSMAGSSDFVGRNDDCIC